MEKNKFIKAEIDIYELDFNDIIVTSGDFGIDGPIDGDEGWGDIVL